MTKSREDLPSYIRLDTACRQAVRFPAYLNP
jgi:hypothetical protein